MEHGNKNHIEGLSDKDAEQEEMQGDCSTEEVQESAMEEERDTPVDEEEREQKTAVVPTQAQYAFMDVKWKRIDEATRGDEK